MHDKHLLKPREAADYLSVSLRTLEKWISEKVIPVIRYTNSIRRIDKRALDAFIRRRVK